MPDDYIGWWAVRPGTKWHLVESEVDERLMMRCGRQMRMQTSGGALSFQVTPTGERCEQCSGRQVAD
jgi:hypothetical protein